MNATVESAIRVGISSCLLGNPVRFDGGHKLDRYLRDTLGAFVDWVPVCPEVECGLPVPREALLDAYLATLLEGLRLVATAAKHANVLQHAAGYFKRLLSPEEKAELGEAIESHRRGLIHLVVPVTLLAHYTRVYGEPWLARQHYLHLQCHCRAS